MHRTKRAKHTVSAPLERQEIIYPEREPLRGFLKGYGEQQTNNGVCGFGNGWATGGNDGVTISFRVGSLLYPDEAGDQSLEPVENFEQQDPNEGLHDCTGSSRRFKSIAEEEE